MSALMGFFGGYKSSLFVVWKISSNIGALKYLLLFSTLSKIIEVDRKTIENIYEPNLFRMGYIEKSTQGRRITKKGMRFIKE